MAAMSAPTAIVSSEAVQAAAPPAAEVTRPDMPFVAAPTSPAIEPPVQQPVNQPSQSQPPAIQPLIQQPVIRKGMSTTTLLVAALLAFVLLAGGAIAAVMFAKRVFRNDTAAPLAAEAEAGNQATPVSNPPQEALLSQAITPSPLAASGQTSQATSTSEAAPATTQQQVAAVPAAQATAPSSQQRSQTNAASMTARPTAAPNVSASTNQAAAPSAPVTTAREPKRRALSGVAVAATGDQALLGAVSSVLRAEAEGSGLEAVNAHDLPSTEDMLQGRVAVRDLIAELRDDGYAVLMLARIEPTGQRELSYHGRRDTSYSARVTVTAYDLASGRPFGTPQSGEIRYTSINVESESQDVVSPLARAVASAIRDRR